MRGDKKWVKDAHKKPDSCQHWQHRCQLLVHLFSWPLNTAKLLSQHPRSWCNLLLVGLRPGLLVASKFRFHPSQESETSLGSGRIGDCSVGLEGVQVNLENLVYAILQRQEAVVLLGHCFVMVLFEESDLIYELSNWPEKKTKLEDNYSRCHGEVEGTDVELWL